jgi:uncharacterized sporulation protein YeaH/YhbH (DUF444 family)
VQISKPFPDEIHGLFSYQPVESTWHVYETLSEDFKNIVCKKLYEQNQVWTVFRELFTQ